MNNERFQLELAVTPEQLVSLEELRGGAGIQFELIVQCETEGPDGILRAEDTVLCHANLSVWTSVLAQLDLKDIVLVAVELPKHNASGFGRTAVEALGRAKQDLLAGDYGSVVSRCRMALDSINAECGDVEKNHASLSVEKFHKNRRAMSKRERQRVIADALRHYTHLAHHVDEDGEQEWYSRADATFALAIAAAAIASELKEQEIRVGYARRFPSS